MPVGASDDVFAAVLRSLMGAIRGVTPDMGGGTETLPL